MLTGRGAPGQPTFIELRVVRSSLDAAAKLSALIRVNPRPVLDGPADDPVYAAKRSAAREWSARYEPMSGATPASSHEDGSPPARNWLR